MSSEVKAHTQSWEGSTFQPASEQELHQAVDRAFDYRGDVTIRLKTGEEVSGFVFDRQVHAPQPFIKVYLPNVSDPSTILYADIDQISFSGEDTAFGRSWEDWVQKWKKPDGSS